MLWKQQGIKSLHTAYVFVNERGEPFRRMGIARMIERAGEAAALPSPLSMCTAYMAQLGGNVRQRGVRLAWLNQRDIFVGVRSAERIKNTFSDDAPILNFCRTFGHHRSPSPANQYCRCRTLSPVAF